jgi:AcrR family transcriptional regulator
MIIETMPKKMRLQCNTNLMSRVNQATISRPINRNVEKPVPRSNHPVTVRKKRRSSEEIVDRLLQAAEQEFKKSGYVGATIAVIAREAEVTEAQLFRCFSSKAELFREAIFKPLDRHFAEFNSRHLTAVPGMRNDRQMARLYIKELQQFLNEHSGMLMSMVVAQAYAADGTDGVAEIGSLRAYFDRGAAMLSLATNQRATKESRLIVRVSFAAVLANIIFKDWLFPKDLAREDEISESIIDFVIDGINAKLQLRN